MAARKNSSRMAVESLDEAVGAGCPELGTAMLDAVDVEMELVRMPLGPAELAAIVGEHRPDRQIQIATEWQHVIVQHRHGGLRLLGDMKEAEGARAMVVNDCVQIDAADPSDVAEKKCPG